MTTLNMHPVSNIKEHLQNFKADKNSLLQHRPTSKNKAMMNYNHDYISNDLSKLRVNAFAPSAVFDNSYFS
jgi:hypothetical protein